MWSFCSHASSDSATAQCITLLTINIHSNTLPTGTTNFVHSFPNVCVSIALVVKKEVVVGVVYNPIMNELFAAAKVCVE